MKRQPMQFEPDPLMESLLDEALAPEAAPRGLVQRTLAATQPALARRRQVLAWLGPIRSVAAVLLLAAELGIVVLGLGIAQDARSRATATRELAEVAAAARIYEDPSARIDDEIQLLAMQLELMRHNDLMEPQWHYPAPMIGELELLDSVEAFF